MIRWMRFKYLYFLISAMVIIPGIFSLVRFGLKPSIDFTGGTLAEYKFEEEINKETVKEVLERNGYQVNSIQSSGENTYLLRLPPIENNQDLKIKEVLQNELGEAPLEFRFETVGPTLGKELLIKTIVAIILAAGFIMSYVAWRFKDAKFGVCAILAMFHDSLVLIGSFSLLGHFLNVEVDTLFVTAVLTVLSFSVHDTIVVYDRIRESQKLYPKADFEDLANKAVTETMSRSLNNSLTIIFMLLALFLLGGTTIKWFVLALLIGTISGTYSSPFNAVPLLVVWHRVKGKK